MNKPIQKITRVMDSALAQAQAYVEAEFAIPTRAASSRHGDLDELILREMTAIIGIEGSIDLFVAFSFDDSLIQVLYERMTEGMDIAAQEVEDFKKATAGEIMNIVLGHCTADLEDLDTQIIRISPPNVLSLMKRVPRLKDADFHLRSVDTEFGAMDVYLIGPKALFSADLEYVG